MIIVIVAEIKENAISIPLNKIGILLKTSFKQLTNGFRCVIVKPPFKISKNASAASYDELLNRLAELEDKIENGTLVEIESPCTEEELERELIDIEIQNMIRSLSVPGGYYSLREPRRKR